MPASVVRRNVRKYAGSAAVTDDREFPGLTHWIIAQEGWQAVADHALHWAETHDGRAAEGA